MDTVAILSVLHYIDNPVELLNNIGRDSKASHLIMDINPSAQPIKNDEWGEIFTPLSLEETIKTLNEHWDNVFDLPVPGINKHHIIYATRQ